MKGLIYFIVCLFLLSCSKHSTEPWALGDDFEIYVSKTTEPGMLELHAIIVDETPLISLADIESYKWDGHKITLTAEAVKRINDSKLNLYQKNFIISVNSERIYAGFFWSMISSRIVTNPVINIVPAGYGEDYDIIGQTFTIEKAYPTGDFAVSEDDPRNNEKIKSFLKAQGKLIE